MARIPDVDGSPVPDATAVTVALWRAVHVLRHGPPHVLEDLLGLRLADPPPGWAEEPRVGPVADRWIASVVARSRFAEDTVAGALGDDIAQYVILGAGLDTFALRRHDLMEQVKVYEVDVSGTQSWKLNRIIELGLQVPTACRFVTVDFEAGESWLASLIEAGFDATAPAIVASLGVTQYLTAAATSENLRLAASLAPGSRYLCTFIIDPMLLDGPDRVLVEATRASTSTSPHPWLSFFSPQDFAELIQHAGLRELQIVTAEDLAERYFTTRSDGLRPCRGESIAVATVLR